MGSGESKATEESVALSGGGVMARAAAFTAPPPAPERMATGLDNYGNTCYCNAVIQVMYHCAPLRDRLALLFEVYKGDRLAAQLMASDVEAGRLKWRGTGDDEEAGSSPTTDQPRSSSPAGASPMLAPPPDPKALQDTVLFRLCELFDSMHSGTLASKRHVGPKTFVTKVKAENIMFRNTQQQDAHEFLMFVLNTIVEDERALFGIKGPRVLSPLQQMLSGITITKTYCGECDTEASLRQTFIDINMDIVPNSSLRHCFDLYSAYETLSGDDKFLCTACTSPVDARRRILFQHVPTVLVVQLKRFSYSERFGGYVKRADRVAFAESMTLVTVRGEHSRYELTGVVVHHGATPNVGHYVALVRGSPECPRRWCKCDDDQATTFPARDLQRYFGASDAMQDGTTIANSATAYLLVYSRLSSSTAPPPPLGR